MKAYLSDKTAIQIASLVSTASRQDKLSGISELLRIVAEATSAYSCILWQVAPGSAEREVSGNRLFVLAQWSRHEQKEFSHSLPLDSSVTGKAILTKKTISLGSVSDSARSSNADPFLVAFEIKTMYSIPVTFLDGAKGAVNLYRTSGKELTKEEIAQAELLALAIPDLCQSIREKISLNLLQRIDWVLHEAELGTEDSSARDKEISEVIQRICDLVADTFQSLETSIFLDVSGQSGPVKLFSTTWPAKFDKNTYFRSRNDGLTGWALAHGKSVRIFDLANFERDRELISREYPGISWHDSLDIAMNVRRLLSLTNKEDLPPLSFMAVPIKESGQVLGIIRCSAAKGGSSYFAESDVRLLELVATQIRHHLSNWQRRYQIEEENRAWRILVKSVGELNRLAYNELSQEVPDERHIFSQALRVIGNLIDDAVIMDVRLLDEESQELYYAQTYGDEWERNAEKKKRRFSVKSDRSAGAFVFRTGRLYEIPDINKDPYYSETFDQTTRMLIAPIKVENEVFGVLDIRGIGSRSFPRHAGVIAEMMGQQLGLYHYLAQTIGRIRAAENELRNLVRTQVQTFEDLQHQLRSPIIQTYARVASLLKDPLEEKALKRHLFAIRGLAGKARRVTTNTRLFAALARGERFEPKLSTLGRGDLIKILTEAAEDYSFMFDPAKDITVRVDRRSFDAMDSIEIQMDRELLEQAVYNILDNAYKYSFDHTVIRIYGGLTGSGRFHITFANKGIVIRSSDRANVAKRGWRSEQALMVTGEGSGIGLWIVDHIMKMHNGELIIRPTSPDNLTEIRLVFPTEVQSMHP